MPLLVEVLIEDELYEAQIIDNSAWSLDLSTADDGTPVELQEGSNFLTVTISDNQENSNEVSFEVFVDTQAPEVTFEGPDLTTETSPTIGGSISGIDEIDFPLLVEVLIEDETYEAQIIDNSAWSLDLSTADDGTPVELQEGSNFLTVTISDNQENSNEVSFEVFVDTQAPEVTSKAPI